MTDLYPSPFDIEPDALTLPFWEAARNGRFLLPQCQACGRAHFYPRPLCPHCGGAEMTWVEARRTALITACTTVHRPPSSIFSADGQPYTLAIAETADGPCLFGRLVGIAEPAVGMTVEIGFEPAGNYPRIVFRTAG